MANRYLDWGGRHPASDFLYRGSLAQFLSDGRLKKFVPAFSRRQDGFGMERVNPGARRN